MTTYPQPKAAAGVSKDTRMSTAPHGIKDISDDALFNIATEAWSTQTDKSWSSDGLEAAVLAVRSAVEGATSSDQCVAREAVGAREITHEMEREGQLEFDRPGSTAKSVYRVMAVLAVPQAAVAATPAAKWRIDGKPDPHDNRYDCERAKLAHGDMTDDEIANAVYLNNNDLGILTAAKERIRWLSRALVALTNPAPTELEDK